MPRTRAIIRRQGRVLFVKNWLSLQGWGLPGGGVEAGEAAVEAIVREIREETGLEVSTVPISLGLFWSHERLAPYRIELFLIDITDTQDVAVDGVEILDFKWIPENEIGGKVPSRLAAIIVDALAQQSDAKH